MPITVQVPLGTERLPTIAPIHLPDIFLQCLAAGDADLAGQLRAAPPPRPYTLSNFHSQDTGGIWRVTLLEDSLLPTLYEGLSQLQHLPLSDENVPILVEQIAVSQCAYAALLAQTYDITRIRLRFISPTSVRTGIVTYPLPDPLVLFQSWWSRWNTFAPTKLPRVLLDVVAVHMAVSYCRIRTHSLNIGPGWQVGFVGRLTLRIVQAHKLGAEVIQQLNVLAAYADFCGSGQRTAQGMGQTRFLHPQHSDNNRTE